MRINNCPSLLKEGHSTYSPDAIKKLFGGRKVNHLLSFSSPSHELIDEGNAVNNAGRLSLSGAQPKFGMVISENNELRYSVEDEKSEFLLKPIPTGYQVINPEYCPANENLTMQLASQIYGIESAPNGLCFYSDGPAAYIVKRFDIDGDVKYQQEDFASLMGLTRNNGGSDYKYNNGSYEECGEVIRRYVKATRLDLMRFFKVVIFNFVTLNDDAHLKNFTLLKRKNEYRLSPAYDLVNTSLQIRQPKIFALDNGLFREGMSMSDTNQVSYKEFQELGRRIGLPAKLIDKEIERFSGNNLLADSLIDRSFLSDELKRYYKLSFHYRQSLLRK